MQSKTGFEKFSYDWEDSHLHNSPTFVWSVRHVRPDFIDVWGPHSFPWAYWWRPDILFISSKEILIRNKSQQLINDQYFRVFLVRRITILLISSSIH
jgi:hypothetical protein